MLTMSIAQCMYCFITHTSYMWRDERYFSMQTVP